MQIHPSPSLRAPTDSAHRPIAGIGRICSWDGGSVWIGRSAGAARPHAHHAIQITIALEGEFDLFALAAKDERHRDGGIVPPHLKHAFDGLGATVAQLFVEPESRIGRALLTRLPRDRIVPLTSDETDALRAALRAPFVAGVPELQLSNIAQQALANLAGTAVPLPIDARVLKVIDALRARPQTSPPLAQSAALAHLSPSRFRHLFAAETGTTYRAWLLWLRLNTAVRTAMQGRSWTDAAHAAGFADSSHLSRTFRRTFGVVPAMLVMEKAPPRE